MTDINLLQKGDLKESDFTNDNSNNKQGIGVRLSSDGGNLLQQRKNGLYCGIEAAPDTPTLDLVLAGNNLSLVVNGVADTVTLPTGGGTPPTITNVSASAFADMWGNYNGHLGYFRIGTTAYPIDKVGRIAGTNWVVFGSTTYNP